MKEEKLLSAMGNIGDDLIAAAGARLGLMTNDPSSSSSGTEEVIMDTKKVKRFSKTALIAAVTT